MLLHKHTGTHTLSGKHVWACVGGVFPMTHSSNIEEREKNGFSQIPYRFSEMFPSPIIAYLSSFHPHYVYLTVTHNAAKRKVNKELGLINKHKDPKIEMASGNRARVEFNNDNNFIIS